MPEVCVDGDNDVAPRLEETRLQRGGLPEVPPKMDDDDIRRFGMEPLEDRQAAVGRSVVDEDHLEVVLGFERARDLSVERLE